MTGMEQMPPIGANETRQFIDLREAKSYDERILDYNFLADSRVEDPENQGEALTALFETQVITTSTILSLGLLARESRTAYAIRQEIPGTFWPETQQTMLDLMHHVRDSGYESNIIINLDDNGYSPFLAVYNHLYDYSEYDNHTQFINFLDSFLAKQTKFIENPGQLSFDDYAYVLRPATMLFRNASEAYFLHKFGKPYLESDILIPPELIDPMLLREFTSPAYWSNVPNEILIDASQTTELDIPFRAGVIALHENLVLLLDDSSELSDGVPIRN